MTNQSKQELFVYNLINTIVDFFIMDLSEKYHIEGNEKSIPSKTNQQNKCVY